MRKATLILWLSFLLIPFGSPSAEIRLWKVGEGGGISWKELVDNLDVGEISNVDIEAIAEGKLGPERADSTYNLALDIYERGGIVWSPQYGFGKDSPIRTLTDGSTGTGSDWSVRSKPYGVSLIIDLGGPFAVDKIVLVQSSESRVEYMKGYEIYLNDGDPNNMLQGNPIWNFFIRNPKNDEPNIVIDLPLQYVRFIKIVNITDFMFVIAEVQVYGRGYTPMAKFISDPIDFGQPVNFGKISVNADITERAELLVRTRTGTDPTPYVYHKKTGTGEEVEISKDEYYELLKKGRKSLMGSITEDTENWSPWSSPYSALDEEITSPGNRQYMQFMFEFRSSGIDDRAIVNSMSVEYSVPTLASELVGEIYPRMVDLGSPANLSYYISSRATSSNVGFDCLEVEVPFDAVVKDLSIDGNPVDFTWEMDGDKLKVFFPENRIGSGTHLIKLDFETLVTCYGTRFLAYAVDTSGENLPQEIVPGDASADVESQTITVFGIEIGESLLESVEIKPDILTPNGDGVNDKALISYNLLQLQNPALVQVKIYDRDGSVVRNLYESRDLNAPYSLEWDGRDDDGDIPPPGVYVCSISVKTDLDVYRKTKLLQVVY